VQKGYLGLKGVVVKDQLSTYLEMYLLMDKAFALIEHLQTVFSTKYTYIESLINLLRDSQGQNLSWLEISDKQKTDLNCTYSSSSN